MATENQPQSGADILVQCLVNHGVEVVFADNELVPVGVHDLDTELIRLADQAIARQVVAP